ncbi:MAG: hypothetical protein HY040_07445 [Planctomycetes bacterium]|nr:hypothetical protein [Planctomycetota bacterium]
MAGIFQLTEWPLPATFLYQQYADTLSATLRRRFSRTDSQNIYDAVLAGILDISLKLDRLENPEDLGGLLYVAALRKLQGIIRSDDTRHCREREKGNESVAKERDEAREQGTDIGQADLLDRVFREIPKTDEERIVLQHWGANTEELAQGLGIQELPHDQQRSIIKPIRDRLAKRLERFLDERD